MDNTYTPYTDFSIPSYSIIPPAHGTKNLKDIQKEIEESDKLIEKGKKAIEDSYKNINEVNNFMESGRKQRNILTAFALLIFLLALYAIVKISNQQNTQVEL